MAKQNINQEVIDQLLVEVTGEIAEYLRKDEADLRKAASDESPASPDEESEGSEGPAATAAPSDDDGGSAPAEASAPDDGGGAPPMGDEGSAAPEMSGAPDQAAQGQGDIAPAPTVDGLQAEYMQLDPEALKMHYLACKGALMAQMGAGPEASAPAAPGAQAPAASAPAAPPAAPEASAPMAMAEAVPSGKELPGDESANGGEIEKGKALGKSESAAEIAKLKTDLAKSEADRAAQEEQLLELALKLTAPLRKSIKGVSDLAFIPKEGTPDKKSPAEGLSKNEIVAKLREKSRSVTLKKSDRDKINQFTCGVEGVTVKDIEHLLAE